MCERDLRSHGDGAAAVVLPLPDPEGAGLFRLFGECTGAGSDVVPVVYIARLAACTGLGTSGSGGDWPESCCFHRIEYSIWDQDKS